VHPRRHAKVNTMRGKFWRGAGDRMAHLPTPVLPIRE